MKPITLEEIDKKKKNIAQSLDQLNLEKRKVERAEKEMLELHRQSLKPLRQILTLPISSKDYQVYENLIVSVEGIGAMVEEWSEGRRADIKKQENQLDEQLNELYHARKKLLIEQESKKKYGQNGIRIIGCTRTDHVFRWES